MKVNVQKWQIFFRSIKCTVISSTIIPVLLLFILLTSYFIHKITQEIESALDEQGQLLAELVANASEYSLISGNFENINQIISEQIKNPQVLSIMIFDKKNTLLLTRRNNQITPIESRQYNAQVVLREYPHETFEFNDHESSVPTDKTPSVTKTLGKVTVLLSPQIVKKKQIATVGYGIIIGLVALLLTILLGLRIGNKFVRRIDAINLGVRRIRHGNYDQSIEEGSSNFSNSEIAILTSDINSLATELKHLHQQKQLHIKSLEEARKHADDLVIEKTQELVLARDEAVKANAENRQLIRGMNRLLEEERRYIAREIHDQLNASLVAIRLETQRIDKLLRKVESQEAGISDARSCLVKVTGMLNDVYNMARQIIHRLRPEVIDALGLVGAIEGLIANFNEIHPTCHFSIALSGDLNGLGDDVDMAIYRIVQEALTNAIKHSKAHEIHVDIRRPCNDSVNDICVTIEDDGIGFDMAERANAGIGLFSMRERALGVDGKFNITSSSEHGTSITVRIPIE